MIKRSTAVLTAVTAVALVVASCSGISGDSDEGSGDPSPTTGAASPTTSSVAVDTAGSRTSSTEAGPTDLSDVRWVINDGDGLIDDRGRVLIEPNGLDMTARRSVARDADGSLYFIGHEEPGVWRWPVDAEQPTRVEYEPGNQPPSDSIDGLTYTETGDVAVVLAAGDEGGGDDDPADDGTTETVGVVQSDNDGRLRTAGQLTDREALRGQSITAANGVTVAAAPTVGRFDPETDAVTDVDQPVTLEVVDADGNPVFATPAGGVFAPRLDLVDFDGHRVMMSRAPGRPSDPMIQHIVYDLDCSAEPGSCTNTFWARAGTASLVGPDRQTGDDDLDPQPPAICPTADREVATPVEMIVPEEFDEGFTAAQRETFERAAAGLVACDAWMLAIGDAFGLDYNPAEGDDGWLWVEFADALRAPPDRDESRGWVWSTDTDRAAVSISNGEEPRAAFRPPAQRLPGQLAVVVGVDTIVIEGTAGAPLAENLRDAVNALADDRDADVVDRLIAAGPVPPRSNADELLGLIDSRFPQSIISGEAQLTDDGVTSWVDEAGPSQQEQQLGFAIADFASGGEGVFPELPLANQVALALGPEVRAMRTSSELSRRGGWAVNATEFRGNAGPFNLLDLVPSPSRVTVGPIEECGPPTPTPPSLAPYRRINILPVEESPDSCESWSAVSLHVDLNGTIHGVSLEQDRTD